MRAALKGKSSLEHNSKKRVTSRSAQSGRNQKLSTYIKPMLARLHDEAFDDNNWIFEIKWDGYRAIAEVKKDNVKLYSRNGLSFLELYPKIPMALMKLRREVVLDGEIVALNKDNKPDFQKLQQYNGSGPIAYYAFDCLSVDGRSIAHLPLIERKQILKELLGDNDVIRYSDHVRAKGKDFFKKASTLDLEGIIAKKADSTYNFGKRNGDWLKVKNHNTQEAIIVGYTPPKGSRTFIGSLVLAIREKDHYKYAGHTGTGFTNEALKTLYAKLQPLVTGHAPFDKKIPLHSKVTWVKPSLVCNVKFTEITADGIMRHPVFQGLRIDKAASEVTTIDKPVKREERISKDIQTRQNEVLSIGGREVTVTNVNKIYWPGENISKGDMLHYYQKVASFILPYLKNRPQSLKRNPNGISNPGFFQKNAGDHIPKWLKTVPLRAESANRTIDYILCNDAATLLYLNNLGCIELNPWSSRITKPDNPDYMIFDLDPSDKNPFSVVVDAALAIRELLVQAGATCYCKTSGSTGLHIYVPLKAKYSYDQVLRFAELVATKAVALIPKIATTERTIAKRRGRLYIDYLQNRKGQTVASVYSVRPKPGATVSTPLRWDEIDHKLQPKQFNIFTMPERLEQTGDLFAPVLEEGIDLRKCLQKLEI
jgi:bifunctional non-homologous end joining protein LigD